MWNRVLVTMNYWWYIFALHVAHCISKSSKALTAIRLIRRFFNTKELLQLVTSNFYSIFYYNSEIWHLNSLKHNLKNKLLSASAKALKICIKYNWDLFYFFIFLFFCSLVLFVSCCRHSCHVHMFLLDKLCCNKNVQLSSLCLK